MAISRQREYLADASGAELTRNPVGLAHALEKIAADPRPLRDGQPRHGAPLHRQPAAQAARDATSLFDTHPPIEKRIAVLLAMAHEGPAPEAPAPQTA